MQIPALPHRCLQDHSPRPDAGAAIHRHLPHIILLHAVTLTPGPVPPLPLPALPCNTAACRSADPGTTAGPAASLNAVAAGMQLSRQADGAQKSPLRFAPGFFSRLIPGVSPAAVLPLSPGSTRKTVPVPVFRKDRQHTSMRRSMTKSYPVRNHPAKAKSRLHQEPPGPTGKPGAPQQLPPPSQYQSCSSLRPHKPKRGPASLHLLPSPPKNKAAGPFFKALRLSWYIRHFSTLTVQAAVSSPSRKRPFANSLLFQELPGRPEKATDSGRALSYV